MGLDISYHGGSSYPHDRSTHHGPSEMLRSDAVRRPKEWGGQRGVAGRCVWGEGWCVWGVGGWVMGGGGGGGGGVARLLRQRAACLRARLPRSSICSVLLSVSRC